MTVCIRCGQPITDLWIDDGRGPRCYVYCPVDHHAWLKEFKVYQAAFKQLIQEIG